MTGASVPTAAQLVGVWARAMTQLWDMGTAWVGMAAEQGYLEQPEQQAWSTSVWFPQHPGREITLAWSDLTDTAGQVLIPRHDVEVWPDQLAPGDGRAELVVKVRRPAHATTHHYRLCIWDTVDRPSTERRYARGFGVPGADG